MLYGFDRSANREHVSCIYLTVQLYIIAGINTATTNIILSVVFIKFHYLFWTDTA